MDKKKKKLVFAIASTFLIAIVALSAVLMIARDQVDKAAALADAETIFEVLPDQMPGSENDTPELIALGDQMFHDVRLSVNDRVSCASCHVLEGGRAGVDNLAFSIGTFGELTGRNSPTVLNAGFHFKQMWDGRFPDLPAQAKGPILDPIEMAMPDGDAVVEKLSTDAELVEVFYGLFPDTGLTFDNIAESIAAFQRTLITQDRFDDFLRGDLAALSNEEVEGLNLFVVTGCSACHAGPLLGGDSFQKMGVYAPYDSDDLGIYGITGLERDKSMFKVPSLRNIELTGPFFHDGGVAELDEAVSVMARLSLGTELTDAEVESIVLFLKSLTDKELAAAN